MYIETDMKYLPLTYTKSTFVTNSNWSSSTQQYLTLEMVSSGGVITTVPFSAGMYTFTLTKGNNNTFELIIRLKHCIFPQSDDVFLPQTNFLTNAATHP